MRIHFYLGPIVRTEIVYHFVGNSGQQHPENEDFSQKKLNILKLFGIILDGKDKKLAENYVFRNIGSGETVISAEQLKNDDRVMILLRDSLAETPSSKTAGSMTPANGLVTKSGLIN